MTIDWENIFKDIGCAVRQANIFAKTVIPTDITAETAKKVAQITAGKERLAFLADMMAQDENNIAAITRMADSAAGLVKSYLADKVAPVDFGSTYTDLTDILAEFAAKMTADSKTVDANTVTATTPSSCHGTGNGTCGTVTPNQMARTQNFRVECYRAKTATRGAMFHVFASIDGQLASDAEADVLYATGDAPGGVSFTIATGGTDFAVGDYFTFSTTSDEAGTFQCFFRDYLEFSLPSNSAGAENILDSWAE